MNSTMGGEISQPSTVHWISRTGCDHLLLRCVYSREVLLKIMRTRGWQALLPKNEGMPIEWWLSPTKRVDKPSRKTLVFAHVVWRLCNERNEHVFWASRCLPHRLVDRIHEELRWWSRAGLVAQPSNG